MGSKSNTMSIGSFILTIVVLLGTVKTYSQNLCASLFAKPSVYGSSFPYLKELNNSSVDLIKVLKNKPQDLDSSVVDQKIAALSVLAEKYFDSNDIKFEKLGSSMTFKNLKYFEEYSTFYPLLEPVSW